MKKERVLAVVLSLAMIFACLPFQYAAAEENSNKVTIYSNDFESGTIQSSANYATEGGWNLAAKAGIDGEGKNSSYAFCPGWMPGQDTARKGWQSSFYYVPESARTTSGIYTFSFDYYLGEKISENCMYICANADDYVTLSELRYQVKLDLKKWYSMKMEVNLDLDTYTFTVYNADGTVAHSETGTYSYDVVTFVEFGVTAASSIVGASHITGNASKIDNFVVTKEDYVEDESIIYSNNFESGTIQGSANYATEGGWNLAAKAGIDTAGKDSSYAFCPGWVPGQDTARKGWQSSFYYVPESARTTSGIYTFSFDYYLGEKISENNMYICANADDYVTLSELRYQLGLELKKWYSMKMEVNLDLNTYTFTVYNADGTVAHSETGTYSYDVVTFVEFGVVAASSIAAASHITGNASKIDNFVVTKEEYVEDENVIYRNNFEKGTIQGSANYATEGGWNLAEKAGIDTAGKDSSYAFCPGWVPGQDTAKGSWQSSSYYLPESKRNTSGTYIITFDYYLGEKINENNLYIGVDGEDYLMISELRYQANLSTKTWYSIEISVNLDADRYDLKVLNADGTEAYSKIGTYNYDTLSFIEFGVTASNNIAAASHITGNASKIDNICISISEDDLAVCWIGSGISSGADYFTISGKAKTKGIEEVQNAKIYTAIYGAGNKLLDVDSMTYSSNSEMTSKQFQKTYNGVKPKYAKMLIWKDMMPQALIKKVAITSQYKSGDIYVLAIGNSFSQDSVKMLNEIAVADGINIIPYNAYKAGQTLKNHYDAWVENKAEYYCVQPYGSTSTTYKSSQEIVGMYDWDYIILQGTTHNGEYDEGLWGVNEADTINYWTTLKNGIASLAPNATRLVNATWAPANEYAKNINNGMFASGSPDARGAYLTALLPHEQVGADIYSTETREDGEKAYIPTAVAVDYLIRHYGFPEYDDSVPTRGIYRDNTCHLTDNVGRVLAGLVWYEMITGIPATENAYQRSTLSARDMAKLKDAAHYACQNYTTYDPSSITLVTEEEVSALPMKVKNGADAIVVFVHDDGNIDTATYLNSEFEKNDLYGTVALIGKLIEDQDDVDDWQEILDAGRLNLASHSRYHEYMGQTDAEHINSFNGVERVYPAGYMTETIAAERARLNGFFPNERILTFVKPGVTRPDGITTQLSDEARAMIREHYIAMRDTGGGIETIPPADFYQVKSLMAEVGTCELSAWRAALESVVNEKGMLVYLFHGIDNVSSVSGKSSKQSDVSVLLADMGNKVKAGKIWSAKFDEAMQYTKEFSANARATAVVDYEEERITVSVTDEISKIDPDLGGAFANSEMYDYPLTIKVEIPFAWEAVRLTQSYNNREEVSETFVENGTRYAYVNVVPDKAAAIIVQD